MTVASWIPQAQRISLPYVASGALILLLFGVASNHLSRFSDALPQPRELRGESTIVRFSDINCSWASDARSPACRKAAKEAIRRAGHRIRVLNRLEGTDEEEYQNLSLCKLTEPGESTWSVHKICDYPPQQHGECTFYSFGISTEYAFDRDLATRWGCSGYAFDPSTDHRSTLTDRVLFFQIGATTLSESQSEKYNWGKPWFVSSVPEIQKFFKHDQIDVLKMDCEGCEYALARDVAEHNPSFFHNVRQFTIEIHISKVWIKDSEHVHNLGLLFLQLEDAGLELMDADLEPCWTGHEAAGCDEEMVELGFPCKQLIMCQNYIFARKDERGTKWGKIR
ncbi:hypothetical protein M427DRAFT_472148 [Gonapodya prolifera JEL478]|uniref:Methyltransferase domain-containing protein n=1 Tax=Gonapodya prolifera (strain JEL478) TaxID=1344416 RepID=A0A139AR54_GONPJ|nr:hypothetical protein M427DRAFT_472148 [Gonapodya prolifera JEL478]|eukprot:KXS19230.1 hypothetical protein M427DRAFT_472148 [Gonapodya prolifera JEL478]